MEIVDIETFRVKPRWVFLKIETNEGIVGWGEPNLEGKSDAVLGALSELEEYLIGKDPRTIEHHWQAVYRGSFYHRGAVLNSALAGIDQALWDIKGKDLGVPVYELLGGPTRESIKVYAPVVGDESPERLDGEPELLAERAEERVKEGYTALKLIPFAEMWPIESPTTIDTVESRVRAVREAVGPDIHIAIDAHGKLSPAMARRVLSRLEPYEPMFVEEPVRPELDHKLSELRASTDIPLATGERRFSRWDFREICSAGVDVFQPDPSHAGGISELRRIATLAETYGISIAPHCPLGPIAVAAAAHVDSAISNFLIQETPGFYGGSFDQYASDGFNLEDGRLHLSGDPGLGISMNEEELRSEENRGHNQYIPTRVHDDGSIADW